MRANECKQTEIIGQCRADIGVERSRHQVRFILTMNLVN